MADKRKVSPHDPGGVGQAETPRKDDGTHFTTFNDGTGRRFSHDADKDGKEIPGSRHSTPQKKK